jgi:hypothetical protein
MRDMTQFGFTSVLFPDVPKGGRVKTRACRPGGLAAWRRRAAKPVRGEEAQVAASERRPEL